jgi:hypothetical protein
LILQHEKTIPNARCQQFLDHWNSLVCDGSIPTLQDFLDKSDPKLQPSVFIVDAFSDTEMALRFFGTALVRLTGIEPKKKNPVSVFSPPKMEKKVAEVSMALLEHPCGTWNIKAGVSANGHELELYTVSLPLSTGSTRPISIVSFFDCTTELQRNDFLYLVERYVEASWIDIGYGTPSMSISSDLDDERIDLHSSSDLLKAFEYHWNFLRGDRSAPTREEFLKRALPLLEPHLTIMDADSSKHLSIRSIGVEVADLLDIEAGNMNFRHLLTDADGITLDEIHSMMVEAPCGAKCRMTVTTRGGRSLELHCIGFPLRGHQGGSDSVVWINEIEECEKGSDVSGKKDELELIDWIDFGWGIPSP